MVNAVVGRGSPPAATLVPRCARCGEEQASRVTLPSLLHVAPSESGRPSGSAARAGRAHARIPPETAGGPSPRHQAEHGRPAMNRRAVTEQILAAKRASGLSFADLAEQLETD